MAKKKSVKRTTIPIPKSTEEISEFIRKIGEHQREIDKIQTKLNNQVERIKAQAITDSSSHQETIDQLFEGIYIFAQTHRDELTEKGKKKTIQFPTGEAQWRLNPPAVTIAPQNVKKVIALCKSMELERFIRVKEEVNREEMLKEPEVAGKIKGVTIGQKEEFVVKPSEIEIEIARDTKKLQKATK